MTTRIGLIGTGTIASAIVAGIGAGSDAAAHAPAGPRPEVWVGPRNAAVAARLARTWPFVRIGTDNQQVVDRCDVICLCVRPQIAEEVLRALRFENHHHVLSAIATWSLKRLAVAIPTAPRITRLCPLPTIAQRAAPTLVCPPDPTAADLFGPLGGAIQVDDETTFDTLCAATAMMGPFFATLDALDGWLRRNGVAAPTARGYLAALFHGLGAVAPRGSADFADLSREFSTAGGLNEQATDELRALHVFDAYASVLDRVRDRIRNG